VKKYEYKLVILQNLRNQMRESDPELKNSHEFVIMQKVLDKLGAEGWEIQKISGDVILKREVMK